MHKYITPIIVDAMFPNSSSILLDFIRLIEPNKITAPDITTIELPKTI